MMKKKQLPLSEQQKQVALEKLWLNYYNDTLREKGLITQVQHRKMKSKIENRCSIMER